MSLNIGFIMKKYISPLNLIFLLWGILLLTISGFFRDYVRSYLYLSIAMVTLYIILDVSKQRKNDKAERIKKLSESVNRMMIMAVVLIIMFAITKQNHI
ncbi:hypothetical protein FLGSB24_31400 [Flavobacterium sp. GSB-24]|nr:c-di-AMP phosphodiesterase-like protein [Flavobacterium sp. SORGH_AS_0622]BDU26396.1 hypothetical protein FLGSB24_31400 [Flavobacterium sp. GSB-24]